jgi:hypothetical protein
MKVETRHPRSCKQLSFPFLVIFISLVCLYGFLIMWHDLDYITTNTESITDTAWHMKINLSIFFSLFVLQLWSQLRVMFSDPGFIKHDTEYDRNKLTDHDFSLFQYVTRHRHDTMMQKYEETGDSPKGSIRMTMNYEHRDTSIASNLADPEFFKHSRSQVTGKNQTFAGTS